MTDTQIAIFRNKGIRRKIYHGEWWFVINDVIQVLIDSKDPAQYFKKMKSRDKELNKLIKKGGVQFVPLKAEYKQDECSPSESFNSPYKYER